MKVLNALSLIFVSAALVAACGGSTPQPAAPAASVAPAATDSQVSGTAATGAVVTLQPASGPEPLPPGPAVMEQISKRFEPDVLYARVGQPVEFRNSEDMPHNVTAIRRGPGTEIFNVGTERGQKYTHTFDRPGQYEILCDVHPGMQATLIAADGARATVADEAGKFAFANVPFGEYLVRVTLEGRTVEQPVSVTGARTEVQLK